MNFAATFDVKINFNDPALFAGFAADFEKLYSKYVSGVSPPHQDQQPAPSPLPTPAASAAPLPELSSPAVSLPDDEDADGDASCDTEAVTPPDKPKRRRRTKAEMEAARAAEDTAPAPAPELPKPHGGGNTGTTAPLELPSGAIQMPAGEITKESVFELLSKVMMLEPDPSAQVSTEVLAPHGLGRMRDAQPEQFKSLCEGLVRLARSRGA